MGVYIYCIKCKKRLHRCRSYQQAFGDIEGHLRREHGIAWRSPYGIDLADYAAVFLKYRRSVLRGELLFDDYEEEILEIMKAEWEECKEFFPHVNGIITDLFAIYADKPGVVRAFEERCRSQRARWLYAQRTKACRRHMELVREHYYKVKGKISVAKFRDYGSPLIQCYKVSGLNLKYLL